MGPLMLRVVGRCGPTPYGVFWELFREFEAGIEPGVSTRTEVRF